MSDSNERKYSLKAKKYGLSICNTKSNWLYTVGGKKDWTKRNIWSKTTLIASGVGGARANNYTCTKGTFFVMSLTLKSLISPFLRENVNLPKKIWQKLHLYFTCQTIKTLVTGICVFGGFKNRFLSNFFGRLTFSRKNVNLPKTIWIKMEIIKTL